MAIIGLWKWLTFGFVSITLHDSHPGLGAKGVKVLQRSPDLLICSISCMFLPYCECIFFSYCEEEPL